MTEGMPPWFADVSKLIDKYLPGHVIAQVMTTTDAILGDRWKSLGIAAADFTTKIVTSVKVLEADLEAGKYQAFEDGLRAFTSSEPALQAVAQEAVTAIVNARKDAPQGATSLVYNIQLRDLFAAALAGNQWFRAPTFATMEPPTAEEQARLDSDAKKSAETIYRCADALLKARDGH